MDSTDVAGYTLFARKQGKIVSKDMPPREDSLLFHLWKVDENDCLDIEWGSLKPAPNDILKMISCDCRSCVAGSCACIDNQLSCTDAYHKKECANFMFEKEHEDEDEEDDCESDEEQLD